MAQDEILGLRELNRALKELDPRKQVNAIRAATRAGLKPTLVVARQLAPQGTRSHRTYKGRLVAPGFLSRNINVSTRVSRDRTRAWSTIGTTKEAYYGRQFVEIGTRYSAPQPWLLPAYESTRRNMFNVFKMELRKKIIAQAKKVRKPRSRR